MDIVKRNELEEEEQFESELNNLLEKKGINKN